MPDQIPTSSSPLDAAKEHLAVAARALYVSLHLPDGTDDPATAAQLDGWLRDRHAAIASVLFSLFAPAAVSDARARAIERVEPSRRRAPTDPKTSEIIEAMVEELVPLPPAPGRPLDT